jgi:hypothetical protein
LEIILFEKINGTECSAKKQPVKGFEKKQDSKEVYTHIEKMLISKAWKEFFSKS